MEFSDEHFQEIERFPEGIGTYPQEIQGQFASYSVPDLISDQTS
jgi:hypothetical protein